MIDLTNASTRDWLRKLGLEGRLVSVDELTEVGYDTTDLLQHDSLKGFAIINARDKDEINVLLQGCPEIDFERLTVYKLA